ncbi:hypothetical protein, partial [Sphingorhabdus sp.]|uniref:hypothetical protein n=2 Tax=Sphingorhabdus sp. TaxID=1902408 RepID=UPI003BB146FD
VQPRGASNCAMTLTPIFALMLAPNPPLPLSDAQMRDIGCVAAIGIIAHEQRSGQGASQSYPDMRESGKRWAGIVGDRVMEESGQPREVVAFAIKQAVEAEQEQAMKSANPAAYVQARIGQCRPIMDAQLVAADAATKIAPTYDTPMMLTPQPQLEIHDPDKIGLFRKTLGEDLSNPHRIRYCKVLIDMATKEIVEREGPDSRDAKGFARLATAFDGEVNKLPKADEPKPISNEELQAELEKEPSKEEKMSRCIRLGETLALAMPPEE